MNRLFWVPLVVVLLAAGCIRQAETPQLATPTAIPTLGPTPTAMSTYTPVPLDWIWQDPAYGAVADNVVSVAEAFVVGKEGERTIGRYGYSDWSVEVVRYLVDPLPFRRIRVCIANWEIGSGSERLPARVAYYHLSPSEHVILFLGKQQSLKEDEFVLPGAPHFEWRKASIEEGEVRFWGALGARHSGGSVEKFIARIQQYAREGGRTVPSAASTYSPELVSRLVYNDTAYLAINKFVVSVIEGIVEKCERTFKEESPQSLTIHPSGEKKRVYHHYSEWSVRVVQYVVNPLPYERITLRRFERSVLEDGTPLPLTHHLYSLSEGEHAIFFLAKEEVLGDDQFTVLFTRDVVVPLWWGKVDIRDGMVRIARNGEEKKELVEEFIARLKRYARGAGRTVPTPS